MADASGNMPPIGAVDTSRPTLGEALQFWKWRLPKFKPSGPRPPDAPKTLGRKAVEIAQFWHWPLRERPAKWWTPWRWKFWHAPPPTLTRSPIPSLANLMKVDPASWDIMGRWANRLAFLAVAANLAIVATYAFIVATQSELPITRGWNAVIPLWWDGAAIPIGAIARYTVVAILAVMALFTAIVLQLGTDFSIPFAAGLAGEKYRVIPTLAFAVLFPICLATTVIMKVDVYGGWGRERIAAATETATIADADQRILDKYRLAVPPPITESDGKIAKADAAISNADDAIKGLQTTRDEQADLRTREEADPSKPGRGPKWRQYNAAVLEADGKIAEQRALKAAAVTERADAIAAKANRTEYDDALTRTKTSVRTFTESQRQLLYDADFSVWLRAGGMAFASVMFVLMSFMIRAARADAAKRSNAAFKGADTKRQKSNTKDAEWGEAAPLGTPALPDFGPVSAGAVAPAATKTKREQSPRHPDKTGDNYGAGANGYEEPQLTETDVTGAEDNGTQESGQSSTDR